ncbi:hypothetical protein BH09ACT1_BH09ACT1_18840 [soil metagenome]
MTTSAPVSTARPRTVHVVIYAAIDIVLVLAFAMIGRVSHGEKLDGTLITFWPFLVGLALGWIIARAWRDPLRINWVAVIIVAVTVVVGMVLRGITGQGVEAGFVIVTTIVLGVFLIGWRFIFFLVRRARRLPESATDID